MGKRNVIIFAVLVVGFVGYNLFFASEHEQTNTLINIIYSSILFLYISWMAYTLLKTMKK